MSHYTVVVVYLLSLCISSALFSQFPVGGGLMSHYTVVVVYLLSLCISSALFSQFPVGGGLMSHYTVVVEFAESVYFFSFILTVPSRRWSDVTLYCC